MSTMNCRKYSNHTCTNCIAIITQLSSILIKYQLESTYVDSREIVIRRRNNNLQFIADTHRSYDALQYPLMFWKGQLFFVYTINSLEIIYMAKQRLPGQLVYIYIYICMNKTTSIDINLINIFDDTII